MASAKTTAVAKPKGTNLPANISAEMQAEVAALGARLAAPTGDRIKVEGKVFTLPNGDSSDHLNCIIVDFVYYNAYYPSGFDRNERTPAECFSLSPEPSGAIPSKNSPDVQAASCQGCWANQFGSAGKGKACKNQLLLAVLAPDATDESPLMIVKASPTALKSWGAYASSVARGLQRPPYGVITEITFDDNATYPTMRFGNPQPIDADTLAMIRGRREEARQRLMVEPDVSTVAANDSKPAKGKLQAPKRRA